MTIKHINTLTLIVLLISNISTVFAQNNTWFLQKSKHGITVYTRENALTGDIEFKANVTIKTTIDTLQKVLKDIEAYTNWMADTKKSSVLKKINSTEQYIYIEALMPWPFENRDMPLLQKYTKTDNGTKIILTGKSLYIPEKQDITRVEKAMGSWELIQLPNNKVTVIYQFMADPGLYIPNWVITLFIVDGPYKTLTNLKTIVEH